MKKEMLGHIFVLVVPILLIAQYIFGWNSLFWVAAIWSWLLTTAMGWALWVAMSNGIKPKDLANTNRQTIELWLYRLLSITMVLYLLWASHFFVALPIFLTFALGIYTRWWMKKV